MNDKVIGYMINETAPVEQKINIIKDPAGKFMIEAILQDMNIRNRNGRFYEDNQMIPALKGKRLTELLRTGNLYSENGHPLSKDIARQQTIDPDHIVNKILSVDTKSNDIIGVLSPCNNARGKEWQQDILEGSIPSYSLRALGTVKSTARGAEVQNMTIITWDRVIYPSHERAYMTRILTESASIEEINKESKLIIEENDKGLLIPINNESVINYIKSESKNIKAIKESMETLFDQFIVLENGKQVQMTTSTGETLIINLESYIQNDIMNYCYSRL